MQQTALPLPSSVQRRVLIVDDERIIADTLALILERAGFTAQAVYSGGAAIEVLDGFRPDVLVCDVMMRGMSGVEAAIEVRRKSPGCEVLLVSGQASTADLLLQSRRLGYDFKLLPKPIPPRELIAMLSK